MSEMVATTIVILLGIAVVVLVLLLGTGVVIGRALARIERRLAAGGNHQEVAAIAPPALDSASGGAFETFLNEDPARRELPKGEQFAAYRHWRQEQGLNWSNS